MSPDQIAVLGAGNMGTALAQVIASNGHHVRAWSIETDVLEEMRDHRGNTRYLAGVALHPGIEPVWDCAAAVAGAALVIVSVPSQVVGPLARDISPLIKRGQVVLNVAKGLEAGTHLRLSQVLERELGKAFGKRAGSMGGPAIAIEMARGVPMAVIIGLADRDCSLRVQRILQNEHLKVETTADVCGVELCATLKNVYAMALGVCDGLGYGTNTKAFLATLALAEMREISLALGGERDTVYGLAGVGDLLTTGYSEHSRNRTLGEKLGSGGDWRHFLRNNTVEGVGACRAVKELIAGKGLRAHLLETLYEVLFAERPAPEALRHFFREFSYG
ncbi:MAG: NAD(P)H-dependent glycerol-3-phosphate dehydrogenase [Dehalococcoidia bacterium]|nr:NAD(P)H-dependent glycerol-3-phosphate dehydrogenase [Dehalococcoidia bacterium]